MRHHDDSTMRTDDDCSTVDQAPGRSEPGGCDAVIASGDRAPDFRLPGARGSDARLFHLDEYVRHGGVLLVFSGTVGNDVDGVTRVAPWFQFDGIRVWLVSDVPYSRRVASSTDPAPGAAVLTDVDGSVTERYGVRCDVEAPSPAADLVVLVDQSRTVRYARWIDDPFDPEPIGELRRTIERVRTPENQETPA